MSLSPSTHKERKKSLPLPKMGLKFSSASQSTGATGMCTAPGLPTFQQLAVLNKLNRFQGFQLVHSLALPNRRTASDSVLGSPLPRMWPFFLSSSVNSQPSHYCSNCRHHTLLVPAHSSPFQHVNPTAALCSQCVCQPPPNSTSEQR